MTIETNDIDVPVIIYYKPKVRKDEQRLQAAVRLTQIFRRMENAKYYQALNKLSINVGSVHHFLTKAQVMARLFQKIEARKTSQSFTGLLVNKIKTKQSQAGCKLIGAVTSDIRLKYLRHAFNEIKTRGLYGKIKELSDGNALAK